MISIAPLDDNFKSTINRMFLEEGLGKEYLVITDFVQNILGYFDEETKENFEPTFNWHGRIQIKLDKQPDPFFAVTIILDKDDVIDGKIDENLLLEDYDNALETVKDYSDCVCSIDNICVYHKTFKGSKQEVYKGEDNVTELATT